LTDTFFVSALATDLAAEKILTTTEIRSLTHNRRFLPMIAQEGQNAQCETSMREQIGSCRTRTMQLPYWPTCSFG